MEAVEGAKLTFGKRLAALPLVIGALLIGNALGFLAVTGYDVLYQQRAAGALMVIIAAQACVGVYLALLACQRFLKDHRYASVWLVAYLALFGLAILFTNLISPADGRSPSAVDDGKTLYLVVNAAAVEIARRILLRVGVG